MAIDATSNTILAPFSTAHEQNARASLIREWRRVVSEDSHDGERRRQSKRKSDNAEFRVVSMSIL